MRALLTSAARGVPGIVWALVAAGTLVRLGLAFTTDGQPYDMAVLRDLRAALGDARFDVYAAPLGSGGIAWPYPPGFFPFVALADGIANVTGLDYGSVLRLPGIVADALIALLVQDALGRRGADTRTRVAATALVALGPAFITVLGYHGQLDTLAILPAVAAVVLWGRLPSPRRALVAGVLIGIGFAIKTTPLLVLLALLPAVRSRREAVLLLGSAGAVAVAALAPFLLATPDDVLEGLRYKGFPGTSGLSILLQPELAEQLTRAIERSDLVDTLWERGQLLVIAAVLAVAALSWRWGEQWTPADRAALLFLVFYVPTAVFFVQYLVWCLPFLLLAGRLRLAAAIQALAVVPTVLFYRAPLESEALSVAWAVFIVALWVLFVVAAVHILRAHRPRSAA